jgi:hypothetical protein
MSCYTAINTQYHHHVLPSGTPLKGPRDPCGTQQLPVVVGQSSKRGSHGADDLYRQGTP